MYINTSFTRFNVLFFHFICRIDSISLWQMGFHFLHVFIYLQFIYFVLIISQTENESANDEEISSSTRGESVDSNLGQISTPTDSLSSTVNENPKTSGIDISFSSQIDISSQTEYNQRDHDDWNEFKVCYYYYFFEIWLLGLCKV